MSVVNKMLQDLEARKSQPDEINADYQPPQKRLSLWLLILLLVLALAALSFALLDYKKLFGSAKSIEVVSTNEPNTITPTKKVMVAAAQEPAARSQADETAPSQNATELALNTLQIEQDPLDDPQAALPEVKQDDSAELLEQPILAKPETPIGVIVQAKPSSNQPSDDSQPPAMPNKQTSFSMSGSTKENQTSSLKQRIAESLNNNDLDLAQSLLNQLLIEQPNNLKARKKLASLYFSQGSYALTRQLLLRGIELHPNQSDLRLMLARLYAVQNNSQQALETLQSVEPNVSNQTEFLAYRAALAQQLKRPEVSKADYHVLSQVDDTNARWWLGLAIARDQLGDTAGAIKAYEKAYSLGQLDDSIDEFIQQRISVLVGNQ